MPIAASTIAFQPKYLDADPAAPSEILGALDLLAQQGWPAVEIWEPQLADRDSAGLAAVAERVRRHDLIVAMISSYYNFTTSDETAAESLANGHRVLAEARALQARSLRIFTGKTRSRDADPAMWQRAERCLRELCDAAADDGIELALHMHDWNLIDDAAGTRRLIDLVDRPNLVVYAKPTIHGDDWPSVIRALREVIGYVQITGFDNPVDYAEVDHLLADNGHEVFYHFTWMKPGGAAACARAVQGLW